MEDNYEVPDSAEDSPETPEAEEVTVTVGVRIPLPKAGV